MFDELAPESSPVPAGRTGRGATDVDLSADKKIAIDISDALCERNTLKFTVHTKTKLPRFSKPEFSVIRFHEDFIWLHDRITETDAYAGYIVPPPPPKPNFDSSREKLVKLGEQEGQITKEEFEKKKAELEAEYLALFKKTVAMHEVFLQRLAEHPLFEEDYNFKVFLEYEKDLEAKHRGIKDKADGFFKGMKNQLSRVAQGKVHDSDEYFVRQESALKQSSDYLKSVAVGSAKLYSSQFEVAKAINDLSDVLKLSADEERMRSLKGFFCRLGDGVEKLWKLEGRAASDIDLKLTDSFHYYVRESEAARELLARRKATIHDLNNATNLLASLRLKNKDQAAIQEAEANDEKQQRKLHQISETGRSELLEYRDRRVRYYQKNLSDLAELEMKHARAQIGQIEQLMEALRTF